MSDILKQLGIEPEALLINLVSFLLLLWLMKRFLFQPVGSFIEQRKERIRQTLDDADAERAKAAAERSDIEGRRAELLRAASDEAQGIKQRAAAEADAAKKAARDHAREIERLAHQDTEREAEEVARKLRDEASDTAGAVARRLLQTTLTDERHRALMDQFIADIERLAAEK
jgi:F-type H+-transporting ATPase subunit b